MALKMGCGPGSPARRAIVALLLLLQLLPHGSRAAEGIAPRQRPPGGAWDGEEDDASLGLWMLQEGRRNGDGDADPRKPVHDTHRQARSTDETDVFASCKEERAQCRTEACWVATEDVFWACAIMVINNVADGAVMTTTYVLVGSIRAPRLVVSAAALSGELYLVPDALPPP